MSGMTTRCPICEMRAKHRKAIGDHIEVDCKDCGRFEVSETFRLVASELSPDARRLALKGAVTRARYGSLPTVTSYDLP